MDKTIRLWSLPTGEPRAVLADHTSFVYTVRFSTATTCLYSAGEDGLRWRPAAALEAATTEYAAKVQADKLESERRAQAQREREQREAEELALRREQWAQERERDKEQGRAIASADEDDGGIEAGSELQPDERVASVQVSSGHDGNKSSRDQQVLVHGGGFSLGTLFGFGKATGRRAKEVATAAAASKVEQEGMATPVINGIRAYQIPLEVGNSQVYSRFSYTDEGRPHA